MGRWKWEREQKEWRKGAHRHRMSGAFACGGCACVWISGQTVKGAGNIARRVGGTCGNKRRTLLWSIREGRLEFLFETFPGDRLTGEILGELLAKLQLSDYIELPVMRESAESVTGRLELRLRSDSDLLDMEYAVTKMEFLVVDVMEAENQNVIMTNKGDFCTVLPASLF